MNLQTDLSNPLGEHGADTKEKGKDFLSKFNNIAFFLFIAMVIVSQFWYQMILQFSRDVVGGNY